MKWKIQQISGPVDERESLELDGYSAPFGRPRQSPVITEELTVRHQTVYYPGSKTRPTRHLFGTKWEPVELHGRWMDSRLPNEFTANDVVNKIQGMVDDQKRVRVSWGNITSFTGILEKIKTARESGEQIAWNLTIQVDEQDGFQEQSRNPKARQPSELAGSVNALQDQIEILKAPKLPNLDDFKPDLLDAIDDAISNVAAATSAMNKLANQIESFETAPFAKLSALRASIHQAKNAFITLNDTIDAYPIDAAIFNRHANADIQWLEDKSQMDVIIREILKQLADSDRKAEEGSVGKTQSALVAKTGDTWESLSTQKYGSPANAPALRNANGAKYGEQPVPGRTYSVPDATLIPVLPPVAGARGAGNRTGDGSAPDPLRVRRTHRARK